MVLAPFLKEAVMRPSLTLVPSPAAAPGPSGEMSFSAGLLIVAGITLLAITAYALYVNSEVSDVQ